MAQSYRSNSKKRKCKRISLELVFEAIAALQETGGSTQNEVCKYLSSKYNLPSTYRAGIAKALRRGIRNSALTYLPRKYRIARRPKSRRGRRCGRRPSRRRKGRSLTRRRRRRRRRSRRRLSQGQRRRARSRRRRSSRRWGSSKRRRSSRRQRRRRRTKRRRRPSRRFNSSSRRRRRITRRYRRRSVGTNVTEEDIRRCPQHLNGEKDVNRCDLCRRQQGLEERGVNKKADIPSEPRITACEITRNDEGDNKLRVAEAVIKAGDADERKLIAVDENDGERQEEAGEEEMDEGENQEETDEEEMDDDDPEWLPENIVDIDLEDSEEEVGDTEEEMEDDGQFFLPDYLNDVDLEEIERQLEESEGQIDDEDDDVDDDEPLSENQLDYDQEYTEGELSEAEEGMEEEDPEWLLNDENERGGEMEPLIGRGNLREDPSVDFQDSGQGKIEGETAVLQEGIEGDGAMEPGLMGPTLGNDEHRDNEDKMRAETEDSMEEDPGQGGQLADRQGREGENEREIPIESELGAGDCHVEEGGQSDGFSRHDRLEGNREEEIFDGTAAEQVDHVQTEHDHRDAEDDDNQPESLHIEGRMRQDSEQEEGHSEYFSIIEQPVGESNVPAARDMGAREEDNQGCGQSESLYNGEPERFETEATNEGTGDINDGEGEAAEHVQREPLQMTNYIEQSDGQDEEQSEYYSIVEEPVEERDVPATNDLDVEGEEDQQSRRQVAFPEPERIERGAEETDEVMVEGDERENEAVEFEDVEDPWIELDREVPGNFEEESRGGYVRNEQEVNDFIDVS